jgi:hypothetical protein
MCLQIISIGLHERVILTLCPRLCNVRGCCTDVTSAKRLALGLGYKNLGRIGEIDETA